MNYRIIDYPHPVGESFYEEALETMTQRLVKTRTVKAVYQVGGVSSPGISDLDMVVVFNDEVGVNQNFLEGLSKSERYLFIHNLYGISSGDFSDAERFAFYHSYRLMAGEDVRNNPEFSQSEIQTLKIQIAMEFLVKMYVTLFLQEKYGVLRMRDILLHVKALHYDLDFLGVSSGVLFDHVMQVIDWRKNWFTKAPSKMEVQHWWKGFNHSFTKFFEEVAGSNRFYLPSKSTYKISKNILLIPSEGKITTSSQGYVLPKIFSSIGKKYFRLQNKLNRFQFEIPIKSEGIPEILEKKFHFEEKIVRYNKKYLPHFLPLTSSLHAI